MTYFAKITFGIVEDVIGADQDFIDTGLVGNPSAWVETSYNTRGGIYYLPDTNTPGLDQSLALRANYAGIGYTYDAINDVFYAPQPYPSWTISAPTWLWQPPVSYPSALGSYYWDELTQTWVQS
jgi:hypothetical protein